MKYLALLLALLFTMSSVHGQMVMNVQLNDGEIRQYMVADIDSITYPYYAVHVHTDSVVGITSTQATVHFTIGYDMPAAIIAQGVCWAHHDAPSLSDAHVISNSGTGAIAVIMAPLMPDTIYRVRAYAITASDTVYGNVLEFYTSAFVPGIGVVDVDGNAYTSIISGAFEWTVQNLRTTRYRNGDPMPNVSSNSAWAGLTTGAYCWYNNNSSFEIPYGKLYNAYAVIDPRGLCPIDWKEPIDFEFEDLFASLDGDQSGGKLKEVGTIEAGTGLWRSPNLGATNEIGFSAVPSGKRLETGQFSGMDSIALFPSGLMIPISLVFGPTFSYDNIATWGYPETFKVGFAVRCLRRVAPKVRTFPITSVDIGSYSVKVQGNVVEQGYSHVAQRGFCWSTQPSPTIQDNVSLAGSGLGIFADTIVGLIPTTTYYVRAYATNGSMTSYGEEQSFNTRNNEGPTVSDGYGNTYPTIILSNGRTWMARNLRVLRYQNGDTIAAVSVDEDWSMTSGGAWCNYLNNAALNTMHGKLYNWYAVADARKVCPTGWHVPNQADWMDLIASWGDPSVAGGLLKSTDPVWTAPNAGATNISGFSGHPSGTREVGGGFVDFGDQGTWWSSTDLDGASSRSYVLNAGSTAIGVGDTLPHGAGASVRCIKD